MAKRITSDRVKKWARGAGLASVPLAVLMIFFIASLGAFDITGYSGDSICAGTIEDPCYAYINFTANEDVFIYPSDDWGQTAFYTDPQPKSVKMYRSWGKGWREIKLNQVCTGTWCGLSNSNDERKFAFAFREDRDYSLRYEVLKESPNQTIKWGFDKIDPVFLSVEEYKSYDIKTKELTLRNSDVEDIAKVQLLTPLNHRVGFGKQRVVELNVSAEVDLDENFFGQIKTYNKKDYDNGIRNELERDFEWKYLDVYMDQKPIFESQDLTSSNGTKYKDYVQVGSEWVESERWLDYDKSAKIKKDENIILGLYTDVQKGDYVEWVQEFTENNIKAEMWATWTADLNTDLVSYFKLDNNNFSDSHGNNDGTNSGTINTSGIIIDARDFDGNDNINLGDVSFSSSTFSVSAWIYLDVDNTAVQTIFQESPVNSQWLFFIQSGDLRLRGGGIGGEVDTTAPAINGWHHVAFTADGTTVKLYIDGVLKITGTIGTAPTYGTGDWLIGEHSAGGGIKGRIDELSFWGRILSDGSVSDGQTAGGEIAQLYNGGVGISYTNVFGPQPPTITASVTKPDDVFTNTDWLINITASDGSDYIDTWIKFYVNDSNVTGELYFNLTNNTNSLIATLGNGNFSAGDNLTAEVWVGNTDGNSSKTNLIETVQFFSMSGTLKSGDGQNLNATVFIINQTDDSLVGNTTSLNGVWTFGPMFPGTYIVVGYDPSNSTLDGDAEPHVVIPA